MVLELDLAYDVHVLLPLRSWTEDGCKLSTKIGVFMGYSG